MQRMRVVMVSKALVVGAYQRKAEEIARLGVALTVLTPPAWRDRRGRQVAQARHTDGYTLRVIPIRFNGNFHLHHYPTLARELAELKPDLLHMDEEPYNLATWLGLRAAQRSGAVGLYFTWQNLYRPYPPPFSWIEQANYRRAPVAIAGNQDAAAVLRRKGYRGEISVIPQFGVDPVWFAPAHAPPEGGSLCIGYAGGLLAEKGVDLLLRACAMVRGEWRLQIAGEGEQRQMLIQLARELGIADRVNWHGRVDSSAMPGFYHGLDVLAAPSRATPTWKEQFGRVLVEAMACGVAVIGSDSGEIPNVIGDAGLLFAEGDASALAMHLQRLHDYPAERRSLAMAGRERVLAHYTMNGVAERTVAAYARALALATTQRAGL